MDCTFENDDFDHLAKHLRSDQFRKGTTVVVAWHHGTIPDLATRLGAEDAPNEWSDEVFDQIWALRLGKDKVDFEVIRQELLFGDSKS